MKREFLAAIIVSMLLITLSVASADVGGACVQQAFQCEGPNGPTIMESCDKTVCDVCPTGSLAHQTECVGNVNPNNPQPQNSPHVSNDLGTWLNDLLRTAMGQPIAGGASVPSSAERAQAMITLMIAALALLALLGILSQIIRSLMNRVSVSKARPAYPQLSNIRKKEPSHDFCTTPEHSPNTRRRKKMQL